LKQIGGASVVRQRANAMTEHQFRKLEAEIARYRLLEREVTDPLAASLIHVIISELEAELQKGGEPINELARARPAKRA
jgi:hypothetical protein